MNLIIVPLFVSWSGNTHWGFGPFSLPSVETGEAAEGLASCKDESSFSGSN